IDLGPIQLQVVEACSGLRYLFPLTSLALLCGYLFQDRLWKKSVLVLSAIPLAIVLNGMRIGMIGVLVEWQGQGAAEGFMHFFEGWVVFAISFGLLIAEMWVLGRIGQFGSSRSLPIAPTPSMPPGAPVGRTHLWSSALVVSLFIVVGLAGLALTLRGREEVA